MLIIILVIVLVNRGVLTILLTILTVDAGVEALVVGIVLDHIDGLGRNIILDILHLHVSISQ